MNAEPRISAWKWLAFWIALVAVLAAAAFALFGIVAAISDGEVVVLSRSGSGTAQAGSPAFFIGLAQLLGVVGLVAGLLWALWLMARGKRPH